MMHKEDVLIYFLNSPIGYRYFPAGGRELFRCQQDISD
jgi:hypothetical protein